MPPYKEGHDILYFTNSPHLQKVVGPFFELNLPHDNELPFVNTRFFD